MGRGAVVNLFVALLYLHMNRDIALMGVEHTSVALY